MRAGFPHHGLIVRTNVPESEPQVVKDSRTWEALEHAVTRCAESSGDGHARVETDMRAHRNPTRMHEVARAAEHLARRLYTRCDDCGAPGFGIIRTTPGLPCAACGIPTSWARGVVAGCARCACEVESQRPDGLQASDPENCPQCNP